jgi:hypothetical protein
MNSDVSRERDLILEVLPKIREYNRVKLERALRRDPMYDSSQQLVFYDEQGNQVL